MNKPSLQPLRDVVYGQDVDTKLSTRTAKILAERFVGEGASEQIMADLKRFFDDNTGQISARRVFKWIRRRRK